MMMPDKTLLCGDCGQDFQWTEGDQEFYESKGFSPPKRCKPCREKRKQRFVEVKARKTAVEAARKPGRSGRGSRGRSRQPERSGNRR